MTDSFSVVQSARADELRARADLFRALRTAVLLAVWAVVLPLLILAGGGAFIAVIYLGSAS